MNRQSIITLLAIVHVFAAFGCFAGDDKAVTSRALVVVDESVYPEIEARLAKYIDHIRREFGVELKALVDDYYDMQPPDIRARLKHEYQNSPVPVVGAIMVGPIPHAIRSSLGAAEETTKYEMLMDEADEKGDRRLAWECWRKLPLLTPAPLYYEDFDAEWIDEDGDGVFEKIETDPENNPTEIWTAWWVPPSEDRRMQAKLLKSFLKKLNTYHSGGIDGRNGMIFIAGNGNSVEITEAWTVLMNGAMESTGNRVAHVASRHAQMKEKVLPKRAPEFFSEDLVKPFTGKRWQHLHLLTHGDPAGYYWHAGRVTTDTLNMLKFRQTGANIITTSGCSNGNFRGHNKGETVFSRSMGNQLLFSSSTVTVAYYGASSPQSTGVFAMYHTELIESLDPEKESYLAEGYYNMRNSDYSWGTLHYFFRSIDGKILSGDPFARYH